LGDVRNGKNTSREFELNYLSSVKEFHGGGLRNITSDEENGITMVEVWSDLTFQDGKLKKDPKQVYERELPQGASLFF
jgi:hypothetical protein